MSHEKYLFVEKYAKEGNIEELQKLCKELNLEIRDGRVYAKNREDAKYWSEYYDFRQYATKILLNSVYGSILNKYMRFYDKRIGQSVTLTGRTIIFHMASIINRIITGKYDYRGEAVLYGDTDSCYFTASPFIRNRIEWNKDTAVIFYDRINHEVNKSFPTLMNRAFNVEKNRCVIEASRELVAEKAFFVKKKKYACLYYDKEGKRLDADGSRGEFKIMGLEIKRSDCPFIVRDFLEKVVKDILLGKSHDEIMQDILKFRKYLLNEVEPWLLGSPKKANDVDKYTSLNDQKNKSSAIPGHIKAAINWNRMIETIGDVSVPPITNGMKIVYCHLIRSSEFTIDCIAYPIEIENRLPAWFKAFNFDRMRMIETGFDNKLQVIFETLDWKYEIPLEYDKGDKIKRALFEF